MCWQRSANAVVACCPLLAAARQRLYRDDLLFGHGTRLRQAGSNLQQGVAQKNACQKCWICTVTRSGWCRQVGLERSEEPVKLAAMLPIRWQNFIKGRSGKKQRQR